MANSDEAKSATTPQFITALITAIIMVGIFSFAWIILVRRKSLRGVFQPRTELAPEGKRPVQLPNNIIGFWRTVFSVPDTDILLANGPDAYLYTRFLKVFGLEMMVPYIVLTIAICVPVSVVTPNSGNTGLNKMSFGNVDSSHQIRHVGHFLVAVVLIFWTLFLIHREYKHFVSVRQAWLSSPEHLALARTRTVLVTNLPKSIDSPSAVRELGGVVSQITGNFGPRTSNVTDGTYVGNGASSPDAESEGGVREVWLTKKVKPVEKVWKEREKESTRLEGGASKLAATANKNQTKKKTPEAKGKFDAEKSAGALPDRYVLPKKQPTWKIGLLGLIGEKHNLETSPVYIREKNGELETLRAEKDTLENGNTAFIRFGSQTEAHAFARLIDTTGKENRAIRTGIEVVPDDVEWSNTSMSPIQRHIRTVISWTLTIILILLWTIPVAFVGSISNLDSLCKSVSFLSWVCTSIPTTPRGIIKGILPPVLLGVLFALLPVVLRKWITLQGELLKSEIELKLFTRFWLFQVIQGFLVVTFASGLTNALQNVKSEVSQLPTKLATNLPGASIFFLTYILTTTFAGAAKAYSRAIPAVMYQIRNFPFIRGNTPRKVFGKKFKLGSNPWATVWPPICLLICITIVYSVIQPIITVLAFGAFIMLYCANKYLLYWVLGQNDSLETGGLFYVKALRTVFVSLYLEEICLAGLFFLSSDSSGKRSKTGIACGSIMAVVCLITALFQIYIDWFGFKRDYVVYAHSSGAASKKAVISEKVGTVSSGPANADGGDPDDHEHAFTHPALWKPQPVIWLAEDPLGIGRYESARINDAGVASSTEYATMNEKGLIDVSRSAPDEPWDNSITAA